jgi:hypothetical protein
MMALEAFRLSPRDYQTPKVNVSTPQFLKEVLHIVVGLSGCTLTVRNYIAFQLQQAMKCSCTVMKEFTKLVAGCTYIF